MERFAPDQVILPSEGRPLDTVKAMRSACVPAFPLDLHLRRPEEAVPELRRPAGPAPEGREPQAAAAISCGSPPWGSAASGQIRSAACRAALSTWNSTRGASLSRAIQCSR